MKARQAMFGVVRNRLLKVRSGFVELAIAPTITPTVAQPPFGRVPGSFDFNLATNAFSSI